MLRDIPPHDPYLSPTFLMNTAPGAQQTDHGTTPHHNLEQHVDPLADVFGSAPSSPSHAPSDRDQDAALVITDRSTEHSDIPRLRSIHVTNGYREGIAVSKEKYIQEGFDEGFSLGGEIGVRVGRYLGVLEGLSEAIRKGGREYARDDDVGNVSREAREEMTVQKILGPEWFGPDGVWVYDMPGQDVEGQVTFGDVADAHPVLRKWREIVEGLAREYGIELG